MPVHFCPSSPCPLCHPSPEAVVTFERTIIHAQEADLATSRKMVEAAADVLEEAIELIKAWRAEGSSRSRSGAEMRADAFLEKHS